MTSDRYSPRSGKGPTLNCSNQVGMAVPIHFVPQLLGLFHTSNVQRAVVSHVAADLYVMTCLSR